ncbi:MAG: helix-turn-helix domain-containing protein [Ktedonobacteraceae bacterium]
MCKERRVCAHAGVSRFAYNWGLARCQARLSYYWQMSHGY